MKTFLILTLMILSLNTFASDAILSVDGLTKLSKSDVDNLQDALIVANNGDSHYGRCHLDWLTYNKSVEVYVDNNSVNPLIIAFSSTEWMKITSDESMTKIVSITDGDYVLKKINNGTILKPDFQMIKVITSNFDCLKD
jgi:hypothetical protein